MQMNPVVRNLKIIKYIVLILVLFGYSCKREKEVVLAGEPEFLRMLNSENVLKLRELRINDLLAKDNLKIFIRLWIMKPHQLDYKWSLYTLEVFDRKSAFHRKTLCCGTSILPYNYEIVAEDSASVPKSEVMKLTQEVNRLNWNQIQTKNKEQAFDETILLTELMLRSDSKINYVVVYGNENTIQPLLLIFNEISNNSIDSLFRFTFVE